MTATGSDGTAAPEPIAATVLAVAVGGALGTLARWCIDLALTSSGNVPGTSTLIVNVLGSLLLGLLVGASWFALPGWLREGIGTGFFGGFTTFSAIALLAAQQAAVAPVPAALGVLLNVVLGLAAAWLGLRLGRWWHSDRSLDAARVAS